MADQGILLNLLKTRICRYLFTTLLRDTLRVYLLFDPISSKTRLGWLLQRAHYLAAEES